ncbi:MAG: DUF4446 family protein [Candidatus Wildermuthbacteria bacterium]|nr:DUF4446 family protein [Candidatus Wildermuthbacteria bacterium]
MIQLFKKKKQLTLNDLARQLEETQERHEALLQEFEAFKTSMRKAITKVGIVRFNPFHETGSDQSFAIALLDEDRNGVVVTSHYLKEYNRVYAKPIEHGKSEYQLSEEEQEAIEQAITQSAKVKSQNQNLKLKSS